MYQYDFYRVVHTDRMARARRLASGEDGAGSAHDLRGGATRALVLRCVQALKRHVTFDLKDRRATMPTGRSA